MSERKYISRTVCGWQVRINTSGVEKVSRCFSDKTHGGRAKALAAAKALRNTVLDSNKITLKAGRMSGPRNNSSKSSTGIIGVSFRGDAWKGHYHDKVNSCPVNKAFATLKYGDCESFEMACQYRFKKCGTLKVYRGYKFPCKIPVPFEYVD